MPDMKEYKSAMNGITASDAFKERTARKMREIRDTEPVSQAPKIKMSVGRAAPLAALAACAAIVVVLHSNLNDTKLYTKQADEQAVDGVMITEALDDAEEIQDDMTEEAEVDMHADKTAGEAPENTVEAEALVEETVEVEAAVAEDVAVYYENSGEEDNDDTLTVKGSVAVAEAEVTTAQTTQAETEQSVSETAETYLEERPSNEFKMDDVVDEEATEEDFEETFDVYAGDSTPQDNSIRRPDSPDVYAIAAGGATASDTVTYGGYSNSDIHIINRDSRKVTPETIYSDYLGGEVTVIPTASGLPQMLDATAADELIREITELGEPVRKDHITPSDSLYVIDLYNGENYIRAYVSTVTVTFRVPGGSSDMYVTYELKEFPAVLSQLVS